MELKPFSNAELQQMLQALNRTFMELKRIRIRIIRRRKQLSIVPSWN
jgi:hypothetical protein